MKTFIKIGRELLLWLAFIFVLVIAAGAIAAGAIGHEAEHEAEQKLSTESGCFCPPFDLILTVEDPQGNRWELSLPKGSLSGKELQNGINRRIRQNWKVTASKP